jgi:hypothetical protein
LRQGIVRSFEPRRGPAIVGSAQARRLRRTVTGAYDHEFSRPEFSSNDILQFGKSLRDLRRLAKLRHIGMTECRFNRRQDRLQRSRTTVSAILDLCEKLVNPTLTMDTGPAHKNGWTASLLTGLEQAGRLACFYLNCLLIA